MPNEIKLSKSWIAEKILAETVITDVIGSGNDAKLFYEQADQDSDDDYVIIRYVDNSIRGKLGHRRHGVSCIFDIVAYQKNGTANMKTVADQLDDMFSFYANEIFQTYYFTSEIEGLISNEERGVKDKDIWYSQGGTYRIRVSPVGGSG